MEQLARERLEDTSPTIPLGSRFWLPSEEEAEEIQQLFAKDFVRRLITSLHSRDDDAEVELLDAAYWVKGCSSLGRLRFAILSRPLKSAPRLRRHCVWRRRATA